MRQKANPGLLWVRRIRRLGHRQCQFQNVSQKPGRFWTLLPPPHPAPVPGSEAPAELGVGFPQLPTPVTRVFPSIISAACSAKVRDASPGTQRGPGATRRGMRAGGAEAPSAPAARRARPPSPRQPAEGAAARALLSLPPNQPRAGARIWKGGPSPLPQT